LSRPAQPLLVWPKTFGFLRLPDRCRKSASATLSSPGAAFLVVTGDLRVSAASQAAEDLFAVPDGTFGRPLMSLLTTPAGLGEMTRVVVRAASGAFAPMTLPVQASASKLRARELEARIGGCGNPPAALVVVDTA
jgi:hypothetical protein